MDSYVISRNVNALPSLAELLIEPIPSLEADLTINLMAELRMSSDVIDIEQRTFEVGVRRAYVKIDLQGLEPILGSRLGEQAPAEAEESREQEATTSMNMSAAAAASTNFLSTTPEFSGELSAGRSTIRTTKKHCKLAHRALRAKPGLSWQIDAAQDMRNTEFLDATFINHQSLCSIREKKNANHNSVSVRLFFRKRDLVIRREDAPLGLEKFLGERNRDAVILAIIARAAERLSTENGTAEPVIVASSVHIERQVEQWTDY